MRKDKKSICIITPVFRRQVGGASTYYRKLWSELKSKGFELFIISEEDKSNDIDNYIGLFPHWASKDRSWIDYWSYFLQNLRYFKLKKIISKNRFDYVLLHSSFLNQVSILPFLLKGITLSNKQTKMILDVRDLLIRKTNLSLIKYFSNVIVCSKNIFNFLKNNNIKNLTYIPVLQDEYIFSNNNSKNFLNKYNLKKNSYLLVVGSLKQEKASDLVIKSFLKIKSQVKMKLVFVGLKKYNSALKDQLIKDDSIFYLGSLKHNETLALTKNCALHINVSKSEGMPRSSLEAIAMKKKGNIALMCR
jgi:glycosyltransferase involved in cell wall biosynthesis